MTYKPLPGPRRLKEVLWRRLEARFVRRETVEAISDEIRAEVSTVGEDLELTGERLARIERTLEFATNDLARVVETQQSLDARLDQLREVLDRRVDSALLEALGTAEDVAALTVLLTPSRPLPPLGGWSLSPDSARYLVELVLELSPGHILECGSGTSTILMGLAMRKAGGGRISSLEHDPHYLDITRGWVERQGLTEIVELIYAPLTTVDLDGQTFEWYDLPAGWLKARTFDFLVVDGPPSTGEMNRYPVLPLVADNLSDRAVVFLDDADRDDERRALDMWQDRFREFDLEILHHRKGTAILRRRSRDNQEPAAGA